MQYNVLLTRPAAISNRHPDHNNNIVGEFAIESPTLVK